MAVIAEFAMPPAAFPLGRVFDVAPDARLELDRVVPAGDTVMPYFWVCETTGFEAVLDCFETLPELRTVRIIEDLGDRVLFRAEWVAEYLGIMRAIETADVTVLSAVGGAEGWRFELRAEAPEQFSTFQADCDATGVDVSLVRLNRLSEERTDGDDLTAAQREALALAYEAGYYDNPRGADLATLAAELGITRQALSARLRRGHRNLVNDVVVRDASATLD